MGFLKFLKKSKEDKLKMPFEEDLDIPPPPPISVKEFPPMPKPEEKIPSFPDLGQIEEPMLPDEIEEPPKIPKFEEISRPVLKPILPPMPEIKLTPPQERMERMAVREGRKVLRHEAAPLKPIFVRVDRFKEIRRDINIIKNDLKNSDEALIKLQDMRVGEDKEFDKWRKSMEDIQKKLIFVDQTLFKGDTHER